MGDRPLQVIPSLVVGLGNPGPKYDQTRHNIGFMLVDRLAQRWQVSLSANKRFQADVGEGRWRGERVWLLKPQTFMNLSGQAIRAAVDWYKLSPQSVLLIYDDMDLPLGRLRLRLSGSAGGHNGVRSAIAHLNTQDFPRLRIGIGSPRDPEQPGSKDTVGHVLGRFAPQEAKLVPEILDMAESAVEISLSQGVEKAMNLYNSRVVTGASAS